MFNLAFTSKKTLFMAIIALFSFLLMASVLTSQSVYAQCGNCNPPPPSTSSPAEQIDFATTQVETLAAAGLLNTGQSRALTTKLNGAMEALNSNHFAAIGRLRAFANQAQAFASAGILTQVEAQPLIGAANSAIDQLQN